MSISNILETSKRSLLNHQSAINTTANNIANVYTEGYTRRTVDLSKLSLGFGQMREDAVSRVKNRFLDNQIWYENQALGKESMNEMLMTQVETIFGEPSDAGLANMLSEFWDAWANLANTPESESSRSLVRDKGILLSNTFNRLDHNMKNLQRQSGIEIQQKVKDINQLIDQLGTVNKQIDAHRSDDLLDQRDVLLGELSEKVDISITENESGTVEVVAGGHILVSEDFTNRLKINTTQDKDGLFYIEIKTIKGDKSVDAKSGQIGGLLEFHNDRVSSYMSSLDEAAVAISKEVNNIHTQGFNLNGVTGMNFFNDKVTGAGDFGLTAEILSDSTLIASSSDSDSQGNSNIAQAISDLQFGVLIKGKSVMDHYNSIIADVGNKVQEARFINDNQEKIIQQLQIQRASVTGVSLDEEMTQLIQFEQAYEAAARMITTLDEMVQTVLAIK